MIPPVCFQKLLWFVVFALEISPNSAILVGCLRGLGAGC